MPSNASFNSPPTLRDDRLSSPELSHLVPAVCSRLGGTVFVATDRSGSGMKLTGSSSARLGAGRAIAPLVAASSSSKDGEAARGSCLDAGLLGRGDPLLPSSFDSVEKDIKTEVIQVGVYSFNHL